MEKLRCVIQAKSYTYPDEYTKTASLCRWQSSSKISGWFVLYRMLMAGLMVGVLLPYRAWFKFFIYLTDLGYCGLMLHFVISAAVTIEQLLQQRDGEIKATWLTKTSWVFYNLANLVPIIISGVFWIALYDKNYSNVYDFLFHALNSAAVLVDLFIGARPFFYLHIYQSVIALVSYLIFSLIYWAAGGTGEGGEPWIYPILDWNYAGQVMIVVVILVVVTFLMQGVMLCLHLLRDFLFRKYVQSPLLDESLGVDNVICET